ncbi:hypothetical protein K9M06_02795 [Candidatus Bipolaricaulota bacterium]|nr:hypothetical protein [Candidatus Bipolaricaulota bacterium]
MDRFAWVVVGLSIVLIAGAIGLEITERAVFPVWEPNYFDSYPARTGPYDFSEKRITIDEKISGENYGYTAFIPKEVNKPLPLFIWIMGSNVRNYYQQSLHETLSSWGYLVIVPETPPFSFTDPDYHRVILEIASRAAEEVCRGRLGGEIDENRIAAGGYSVGASLAAFLAVKRPEIDALVYWAPSIAPYWLGVEGRKLYSRVNIPALYVVGELDDAAPLRGGYTKEMQEMMPDSPSETIEIKGGNHLYFQQPTGADKFAAGTDITRFEQQRIAINSTRKWLNDIFKES